MEGKLPVSVCIVACNEEKNIGGCLESVSWADEIIVVDSFSADRTVELAKRFTDRVIQRKWSGYLDQKKFAIGLARNEWVLLLDADEQISEKLAGEIRDELTENKGLYNGYCFPRKLYYLGRWIKRGEWYPDYKLRLFRKSAARITGMEPHDSIVLEEGGTKRLGGDILHYSYKDIAAQMTTLNRYSSISAGEMYKAGVKAPLARMFLHPVCRFMTAYIFRRGFMDGVPGMMIAVVNSFYVFLKYAKLWELYRSGK